MRLLLATAAAALAAPATAFAAGPTMVVRDVLLHGAPQGQRALAASATRFNMVGVHWRGRGAVWVRTRSAAGTWSPWWRADADQRPDGRSVENRIRGWHLGNPVWTGTSTAIRFRTTGRVAAVRAYYIWTPDEPLLPRRLSTANAPPIVPRLSWGADESIRRGTVQVAPALRYAVIHHTAGSNDYTAAQSAAIVRGIYLYHVQGNGWNDIGYNFLVDKYGQVFEGRFGGYEKAVVGAHAGGFNTGSVGIAVLGSYGAAPISPAAQAAVEQLLAWRLDVAHVDPLSSLTVASGGNDRFPAGVAVNLRTISGHRDTGFTECPGDAFYAQLPQIAKDVAALGGPKIYAPLAAGTLGAPVRFTGRLSAALPWTVSVADSSGATVAQGAGTGTAVDWTWDATSAPADRYTWTIATPGARAATGTFGAGSPALAVQKAVATPAAVAPGETTTIGYALTAPALVTVSLATVEGQVATLASDARPAGPQTLAFTPQPGIAAGLYTIQIAAAANGKTAAASVPLVVDDSLGSFAASPAVFSVAKGGAATLTFTLLRAVSVQLQVKQGEAIVASQPQAALDPGPQSVSWNGTLDDGTRAVDGVYTLALSVTTPFSTFVRSADVTVDSTPPVLSALSYPNMRVRVSEPATLTLLVGTRRYRRVLKRPAATQFWLKRRPRAYAIVATDAAGNSTVLRYRARQPS